MLDAPWFYQFPFLLVWAGILAILGASAALGRRVGGRAGKRDGAGHVEAGAPSSPSAGDTPQIIASSLLGLLALILGFTFSMASARFEGRRQLAIDEANAIDTVYLRSMLLRGPEGAEIRDLLRKYLDARIAFYSAPATAPGIQSARKPVTDLQERIWQSTVRLAKTDRGAIESIFATALDGMMDLENSRTIALVKTLPEIIYWVILTLSAAGIFALEFSRGARRESGFGWSALLVSALSFVIIMIHDLDRPRSGMIRITQDALIELRDSLSSR